MLAILSVFAVSTYAVEDFLGWSPEITEGPSDVNYFPYMGKECDGPNCSEMKIFTNQPEGCEIDPTTIHDGESFPCSEDTNPDEPLSMVVETDHSLNVNGEAYTHADWPESMGKNPYTVALWVKPNQLGQWKFMSLFNTYHDNTDGFQIDTNGRDQYRLFGRDGNKVFAKQTIDTWDHLAVTADGANMAMYFNGVKVHDNLDFYYDDWDQIELGRNRHKNNPGYYSLDDVTVWGKVLSAEEINSVMNGHIDASDDDLLVYWDMNQGAGETLIDQSGNGHDAEFFNGPTYELDTPLSTGRKEDPPVLAGLQDAPAASDMEGTSSCPAGEWMVGFECLGEECKCKKIRCGKPVNDSCTPAAGTVLSNQFGSDDRHTWCPPFHYVVGLSCYEENCGTNELVCAKRST